MIFKILLIIKYFCLRTPGFEYVMLAFFVSKTNLKYTTSICLLCSNSTWKLCAVYKSLANRLLSWYHGAQKRYYYIIKYFILGIKLEQNQKKRQTHYWFKILTYHNFFLNVPFTHRRLTGVPHNTCFTYVINSIFPHL